MVALAAMLAWLAAAGCGEPGRPADPIVIAIANSPAILDQRIGTDEYSQKAHQCCSAPCSRPVPIPAFSRARHVAAATEM